MEEKNVTKISLSTFLLILAIIAIIVMGIFIYKLNNDKTAETQKSTELQSQVNSLNGTVSDLQEKINKVSETINSSGKTTSIIELEVNTQYYRDNGNPSTRTWGLSWDTSSPIKSIDNYGDNINIAFGKNIKYLFCGGAAMSKETRKVYKDKGLCLMQAYALSETASSLAIAYPFKDDLESSGTIFEDMDVKVDNPDENGVGEIIVKGDSVFLGYTDKTLTEKVFDKDGYFHTGDLGYIKNNNIYLKGRKKKMLLTSNGENVMAESIENAIKSKNENINDVKAYVEKDQIVVNIYLKKEIDVDSIIKEYNSECPKYERVKDYKFFIDSIDNRLKQ